MCAGVGNWGEELSVSRPTSVLGGRQQSWVASSQVMFKPMRGAGSAFSNARFEAGQVRVLNQWPGLLSNSKPIKALRKGVTASKVRRILHSTAEAA